MKFVENIAHRGASLQAPENTVAAFDLAIDQGADRIELDVQLTSDGRVVVCHDPTLVRMTDVRRRFPERAPWNLSDFLFEEVARLEVAWPGGRDGRDPARITTLSTVLDHLQERTTMLLELKDPARHPGLVTAVAEELRAHPWWLAETAPERLTVQSFDAAAMAALRPLLPSHVRYGWLTAEGMTPSLDTLPDWIDDVAVDHEVATHELTHGIRRRGRRALAYTVNDRDRMATLVTAGLDGIITDDPAGLTRLLQRSAPAAGGAVT